MKYVLILLNSILTIIFYNYVFDNGLLGIIVSLLSLIMIKDNFKLDKRFNDFINNLSNIEYKNIEEALEEFKESKNNLKKLFNESNITLLENLKKLKITRKELNRFIEIQSNKNNLIIEMLKKRTTAYTISFMIYLLSFLPFLFVKFNNPMYYFKIYNNGKFIIFLTSIVFIIFNNLNLYFINKKNVIDNAFYDNYSLCFHKNCLDILEINDERLMFDSKGNAMNIDYESKEKNFIYHSLLPLITTLLSSIILILI